MAKRTPPTEQEYRPVNEQLARSVLAHRARRVAGGEPPGKGDGAPEDGPGPAGEAPAGAPPTGAQGSPPPRGEPAERGRPPEAAGPAEGSPKARRKEMTIEKRMMLSPDEEGLLEELVGGIRRELRVKVNGSNVLRACVTLLFHVQDEVLKQCRRMDPPRAPRKDDPNSIRVFEEHLARLFDSAVRNTKTFD